MAETARAALEASARGDESSAVSTGPGKGEISWVKITSESFKMGSNKDISDEKLAHQVRVKTFWTE